MDDQKSAELICQNIREDAQKEVDSILGKARQNARLRVKLAQGEAKKLLEDKKEEAEGKAVEIRKRLLSTVGLERRKIIAKAKEEIIDSVLEEVRTEGKNFRLQKAYPQWLKSIIIEGVLNIDQPQVKILASSLDFKVINENFISEIKGELKKKHNVGVEIEAVFDEDIQDTGVNIKSKDGRIIFLNTFGARMERQKNELRLLIYKKVFGDD